MRQFFLLLGFCAGIVLLWMLPVLLAGYPYVLSPAIKATHLAMQTGDATHVLNPLFTGLIGLLLPVLDWKDALAWSFVSAVTLALALVPLWYAVLRLFDARLAWITIFLFALLPMHWREAVGTGYYPLAYLCLFSGFAAFAHFAPRRRWLAVAGLGLGYGLTVATTHAFIPLLPWFCCVYLWERRKKWRRGVAELALCGACAYAGFVLPLLPRALEPGMTASERAAVFLPIEENLMQPAELYGDDYAATFLKQEFDARMVERGEGGSFFERRDNENFRINHAVGSFDPIEILGNGAWLFLNALPSLFMEETVGGVFLWLFLMPGILAFWKTDRRRLLQLLGLWLSMELILRFGFHYARIHLMDVGWIVALLAAAGAITLSDTLAKAWKTVVRPVTVLATLLLVIGLQLLQANRRLLAREYDRSGIPRAQAAAAALAELSAGAVIARPPDDQLMVLTEREAVVLHPDTLAVLEEKGRLAEPFARYGISHVIGYSEEDVAKIRVAVPAVQAVEIYDGPFISLSAFQRWVLNVLR